MDLKLKQRLVGAVVLVALAVIFIPVILEGPSDEWEPRSHSIPVPPRIDYQADVEIPEEGPTATMPEAAVVPVPESPATVEPPAPTEQPAAEPPVEPVAPAPPAATAKPPETAVTSPPPPQAAAPTAGWYVQVGSFGQEMNANGLRERLAKAGFSARLEESRTDKGTVYRVLVGPEKQRAPAERLRDRLATEQQLKGIVVER
jgi:DedD protein